MLTTESPANPSELTSEANPQFEKAAEARRQARIMEALKVQYRADQQEKFLHLQAETDSLLQQLRAMKQQREVQPDPVLV
jgi:hypothetical protein